METRENEREVRLNALGIRRIAGMLLGAGAGVLILFIGFWRTALIAACAAARHGQIAFPARQIRVIRRI